jgi:hypothetical protein
MKRTIIEKMILVIAYSGLIGGILLGTLISKGIWESGSEMCAPRAFFMFVGSIFISVGCWAILLEIIALSDRIRNIENKMS